MDNGDAAIARERAEHEAEEENAATKQTRAFNALLREKLDEDADARFKSKLAYWRSQGAPPYHGPRAVERS